MLKRPKLKERSDQEMELMQMMSPMNEDFSPFVYEMPVTKEKDTPDLVAYIYKEINEPHHYIDFVQLLNYAPVGQDITIHINSPGGSLSSCMSIVNAMMTTQADIHTVIDGDASSAAAFIWLAGNRRSIATKHTNLMIHGASCGFGNAKLSDITTSVNSVYKTMNGLLDTLTIGLLTDEERLDISKGMDVHLNGEELIDRMCID